MKRKSFAVLILSWVVLALAACNLPGVGSSSEPPSVVINSPAAGTEVEVGDEVPVQSTSTDDEGVSRVELSVNGQVMRSDNTPEGDSMGLFALVQPWIPNATGSYSIQVVAYDEEDNASDPALITVNVAEATEDEAEAEEAVEPCTARSNTDLNVRTGPGTNFAIAGILQLGQTAPITGRDAGSTWWQIEFSSAPGSVGWISVPYVSTTGDCSNVPVTGTASGGSGGAQPTVATETASETETETATTEGGTATVDVQISSISMPTSINLNDTDQATVTITVTIINNGGADATSPTEAVLYPLGGNSPAISLGSATLTAGESRSFVTDYTYTSSGSYTVRATAGSVSSTLSVTVNAYSGGTETMTPEGTKTETVTPEETETETTTASPPLQEAPNDLLIPGIEVTVPPLELVPTY